MEREPGTAGVHPDAIIDDVMVEGEGEVPGLHDSHDTSGSDADLSGVEASEEEDEADLDGVEDNFNSAGEEVRMHEVWEPAQYFPLAVCWNPPHAIKLIIDLLANTTK